MMPKERYQKLKEYLSAENPILLDVIGKYESLDKLGHSMGFIDPEETYTSHISWWPMISVLGTFSAGKSTFVNSYLGENIQDSGNQAVDDKFTVICYGNNEEPVTLPGLDLDADPRFPFYNISEEVNKVDPGEGNRVNLYLQLKTLKSDRVKGRILIDSPGFDADSQRDGILKITNHIVEMSDLVLIFFDARHPEPGAMRDTLEHLVSSTIKHRDANKVLYILNQIDTTAKEDNLEDVIGSWQRALSKEGLISGNFYGIYDEDSAMQIDDESLEARLKKKKNDDLARILDRMDKVSIERAYRIIKSLEDFSKEMKEEKMPRLQESLQRWSSKVFWADVTIVVIIAVITIFAQIEFSIFDTLFSSATSTVLSVGALAILLGSIHMKVRSLVARYESKIMAKDDISISKAILHNTRWFKPMFGLKKLTWQKKTKKQLKILMKQSRESIQRLNDQFVSPSGDGQIDNK